MEVFAKLGFKHIGNSAEKSVKFSYHMPVSSKNGELDDGCKKKNKDLSKLIGEKKYNELMKGIERAFKHADAKAEKYRLSVQFSNIGENLDLSLDEILLQQSLAASLA